MSKSQQAQGVGKGIPQASKGQHNVPIVLVIDRFVPAVVAPYCQAIIGALQLLHPGNQLLLTSLTPSSHALPTHPFLAPSAFMDSLPAVLRQPARPTPTVWRSAAGMLRAITTAKKILESPIGGVGSEKRGQLPRYVVVISGTDLESRDGDDIWLEDEEAAESWQSVATTFTRGAHQTTLFSLITLGHTPNLESFWKASASRFPANLVYNSTTSTPSPSASFPLYSASHACFLVGFYNTRNSVPALSSAASTPVSAPSPVVGPLPKRVAAPEPATTNKKQKPNVPVPAAVQPPPIPVSAANVQSYLASQAQGAIALKQAQQATQAAQARGQAEAQAQAQLLTSQAEAAALLQVQQNAQRGLTGPSQPGPQYQRRPEPQMGPGSNQSAEQLQQYINDMKVSSTRQGTPLNLADVQAAMSNYNAGQAPLAPNSFNPGLPPSRPPSQPPPANASAAAANATARQQLAQNQNAMAAQQQQQAEVQRQLIANQLRNPNANPNLNASGLTQQHTNGLPNLPPEMQLKIQTHYEGIKQKVARGEMTAEEASAQIKRLQDVAATHRMQLAQQMIARRNGQQATGGQNPAPPNRQGQQQGRPAPAPPQNVANQYPSQAAVPGQQQYASQAAVAAQNLQYANAAAAQAQSQRNAAAAAQSQQQYAANQAAAATAQQAQQARERQDSNEVAPVWSGMLSWSVGEPGAQKQELLVQCTAVPMQQSTLRDLAQIKWPSVFRISSMIPVKMADLQDLAMRFTLPTITILAVPNDSIRADVREKMAAAAGGRGNTDLYQMFAQSMEHRSQCGVVKFGLEHNIGMVVVATGGKQARFIGIVFQKIPIPDHWLNNEVGSLPRPQVRGAPPQQQARPPPPQQFAPQFQQMHQPQQAFNPASLAGMNFEQLQQLLTPEQLQQLLANNQKR